MRLTTLLLLIALSASALQAQSVKPLVLEKDQGEKLFWRPLPSESGHPPEPYMLKVTPGNSGSRHLVFGTEDIEPGGEIERHKHLRQDEIVFIQAGVARVTLNDKESMVHAGGTVFIPAKTWISFKNMGKDPLSLIFVFSAPGFETYMRCSSSASQPAPPITQHEDAACARKGDVVYQELPPAKKK
jgi:oxalate decarboxylase/phosphoglucose isomerase-like protein (cupin superfamily)